MEADAETQQFFQNEEARIAKAKRDCEKIQAFIKQGSDEQILDEEDMKYCTALEKSMRESAERDSAKLLQKQTVYHGEIKSFETIAQQRKEFFDSDVCNEAFEASHELLSYIVNKQQFLENQIALMKQTVVDRSS